MAELPNKLMHFTNTVIREATISTENALLELEERKAAALAAVEEEAKLQAKRHIKDESKRIRAEAGREVSQNLMDCKRSIFLRRDQMAHEVFDKVRAQIAAFTASDEYPDSLKARLESAVEKFGVISEVIIHLREEDMRFSETLSDAIAPIKISFRAGEFSLGGLIVDCPEISQSIDGSYDSAIDELFGSFAEHFGLSLADDFSK